MAHSPPPGAVLSFDAEPLEKTLEAWLVRLVRKNGGRAYKFTSPGTRSVPDRLVLFPGGVLLFMELKRRGRKATPKQAVEHRYLRELGFAVFVCDSKASIIDALSSVIALDTQTRV